MCLVYATKYFPVFTAPSYYFPVTDIIVFKQFKVVNNVLLIKLWEIPDLVIKLIAKIVLLLPNVI